MISKWKQLADRALAKIGRTVGFSARRDLYKQIADQLVADGDAPEFLKCARRGRPTSQPFRTVIVEEVERMIALKKRAPRVKPREPLPLFPS